MKLKAIAAGLLVLASCAVLTKTGDMIPAGPKSAVTRSVERVVNRHDAYVQADESVNDGARAIYLADSAEALSLVTNLPEVQVSVLSPSLGIVMERHDAYVTLDAELDDLERDIYLQTTSQLRDIISEAERGQRK